MTHHRDLPYTHPEHTYTHALTLTSAQPHTLCTHTQQAQTQRCVHRNLGATVLQSFGLKTMLKAVWISPCEYFCPQITFPRVCVRR